MTNHTLFFSYASADLADAVLLEAWLQAPPRSHTVWRDRRGIPPGAPNYYEPIAEGIQSSANFLVQLSPHWLRSRVSAQEIVDAHSAGKKLIPVVHPAIPRDPATADGRARKSELMEALEASAAKALLEPINWIWLTAREGDTLDYAPIHEAIATDFAWKRQHSVIVQRLARWQTVQDASALIRGAELAALISAAFASEQDREPRLTDDQREFLLASQRHDSAERERTEALYAGAHARSLAFAARERGDAEPDTALLLASEAATVASVPEARAALGLLLDRHASLSRVIHQHGPSRNVSGLAFSPDDAWLASVDRPIAINDERAAQLLIHDVRTGRCIERVRSDRGLTAVAWGSRWLATASAGSIGWLRWDDDRERFRGNTPTALAENAAPDFLVFSPSTDAFPDGELLAWGTRWGDIGVIRVGDHARLRGRVADARSSDTLAGLAWLADGRLLTAEPGRIVVRDRASLDEVSEVATPRRVFSLACVGNHWVASCVMGDGLGVLFGKGDRADRFVRNGSADIARIAVWAGDSPDADVLLGSTSARSGAPLVTLAAAGGAQTVLLQGEEMPVSALAAHHSGQFVAAGDVAGRVWLWDRARHSALTRALVDTETGLPDSATDAPFVATRVGADSTVIEVRHSVQSSLRTAIDAGAAVHGLALDPRGRYVYALIDGLGMRWRRWPIEGTEGAPEDILVLRSGMPDGIAVAAGDERLVIADGDDLVFMPVDSPDQLSRRAAHDNPVKRLAATAELVASVACSFQDTRIDVLKLWTAAGDPLGTIALPGHVAELAIAPDGHRVVVLGTAGERWELPLGVADWAATAARIAGRSLTDEEQRRYRIDAWRARAARNNPA